jgi:hypothetical protein
MKSPLRTLAADYAEGKLDRTTYLQQRAELIETMVAENISADSATHINSQAKIYSTHRIRYSTIILLIILIIFVSVAVWLANGA